MSPAPRLGRGRPWPLGATPEPGGVNFAVVSRHATRLYLELYDAPGDGRAAASFGLDPARHRTGDVWHAFVAGVGPGQLYGWRADGPFTPDRGGHRFNVHKLLADPYARALAGRYDTGHPALLGHDPDAPEGDLAPSRLDSAAHTVKSMVLDPFRFAWGDDRPPRIPLDETVVYEVHVRGATRHPSSGVAHPGTYLGLAEKLPELRRLGVTTLELLPVHHFDPDEPAGPRPHRPDGPRNYWGYATLGFFAPHRRYASGEAPGAEVAELQELVRRCHAAGMEVVLDVVFNHTGEGDPLGPTLCFRGLDNALYYHLDPESGGRRYRDFTCCGNTLRCDEPAVKQLILDCLRYWVTAYRVDGFRFDLAPVLGRGEEGAWIPGGGLLRDIARDPLLRGCKLIAEPWDAAGLHVLGRMPEGWSQWNDRFRDQLRRAVRGDRGQVPDLARRVGGSRDLLGGRPGATPLASVNFVTAHDGFTLRDLVSYARKHNEANGEGNRDGAAENFSANHGVEGETRDPDIRALRRRQAKNLLALLLLSRGVPMILGGDERWRTQRGNNNAYCQDNEISWIDWTETPDAEEMHRFTRMMLALRRAHPALRRARFVDPFALDGGGASGQVGEDIAWHGVRLGRPDWSYHSHTLAWQVLGEAPGLRPEERDDDLYVAFNGWQEALAFELPPAGAGRAWRRLVDTAAPPPEDIVAEAEAPAVRGERVTVAPRSLVVLVRRPR